MVTSKPGDSILSDMSLQGCTRNGASAHLPGLLGLATSRGIPLLAERKRFFAYKLAAHAANRVDAPHTSLAYQCILGVSLL